MAMIPEQGSLEEWRLLAGSYPGSGSKEAIGHAVRAGYLYSAVADVAALTGDEKLLNAVDSIWTNMVTKKNLCPRAELAPSAAANDMATIMRLPNATAYNETMCGDRECVLEPKECFNCTVMLNMSTSWKRSYTMVWSRAWDWMANPFLYKCHADS